MTELKVSGISKHFGGIQALMNVDLDIKGGEILGVIGPNGAGKSTLFTVITGTTRTDTGKITLNGEDVTHMKPDKISAKGLIKTFQETKLFWNMSVFDNVLMGCHNKREENIFEDFFGFTSTKKSNNLIKQRADKIIKFMGLESIKDETTNNLPHGMQKVTGVAIALAAGPKVLCLDEPICGMNHEEIKHMVGIIKNLQKEGIAILLVEHIMHVVMDICDKIVVLNFGSKIAEGRPEQISNNKDVIEAYLGKEEDYQDVTSA